MSDGRKASTQAPAIAFLTLGCKVNQAESESIAEALQVDIAIPDHTTLSRRGGGVTILPRLARRDEPLHLLVDSTGLKMYGEGEWLAQNHGMRLRRRWRKLHLCRDPATQEIAAAALDA